MPPRRVHGPMLTELTPTQRDRMASFAGMGACGATRHCHDTRETPVMTVASAGLRQSRSGEGGSAGTSAPASRGAQDIAECEDGQRAPRRRYSGRVQGWCIAGCDCEGSGHLGPAGLSDHRRSLAAQTRALRGLTCTTRPYSFLYVLATPGDGTTRQSPPATRCPITPSPEGMKRASI